MDQGIDIDINAALTLWPQTRGGRAALVNHSENHTFRIDLPDGLKFILRVHRLGYQSRPSIQSEMAWLQALAHDIDVPIPRPLPGANDALIQTIGTGDNTRLALLFAFELGVEPLPTDDLVPIFARLGTYAATLHNHVQHWQTPPGFIRQVWSAAQILDADGLWGDWRQAPHVDAVTRTTLDALDATLRQMLHDYGTAPERFGLIHADMRLGNLLVDGANITLIDFDDCGYCWFAYEFAAAISFHETDPIVPALKAAWLASYTKLRPLDPADIAAMDAMILLRRMALLAWIGSHSETKLAQSYAPNFAAGTVTLSRAFLDAR